MDENKISTHYITPYTGIDLNEGTRVTIDNLVMENNLSVINIYVGPEALLTLNDPDISNIPSITKVTFTQAIWLVTTA